MAEEQYMKLFFEESESLTSVAAAQSIFDIWTEIN